MKLPAAAAGITKRQSRSPSRRGSVDANRKSGTNAFLVSGPIIKSVKKGRNEKVSALFHVSSHAVVGRRGNSSKSSALALAMSRRSQQKHCADNGGPAPMHGRHPQK
jgi:hypothetical protein